MLVLKEVVILFMDMTFLGANYTSHALKSTGPLAVEGVLSE